MAVIGAIGCAEVAAHALAIWPTSPLLWYLNLEVFQSFRYSFASFGVDGWPVMGDGLAPSAWLQVALIGLVGCSLIARIRLPLAIASNLSLIYSVIAFYGAVVVNGSLPWGGINLNWLQSPSCLLAAGLLVLSLLSSTISHRSYWREIFS